MSHVLKHILKNKESDIETLDLLAREISPCHTFADLVKQVEATKELLSSLTEMSNGYGALHDGLSDMLGDGKGLARLYEEDYQWLVDSLAKLVGVSHRCNMLLHRIQTKGGSHE